MQRFITIFLLLVFLACSGRNNQDDNQKLSVLVSVVPQKYFVEKIAGDLVEVTVLIPPGASPTTYEISPSDMRRIAEGDIWFTIGLQRETTWIPDFSSLNTGLRVISTIDGIERQPIGRYGIPGEHPAHDHGDLDPHVWISPELVSSQVTVIYESLCAVDPGNCAVYSRNLSLLQEEIQELQSDIHNLIDPFAGEPFMVFHPAWGYFSDEFNLLQVPIEISGSEPSPAEMAHLIDYGIDNAVRVVFVSPQFSESSAETIADQLNAGVIVIDPLASDWSENLLYVAGELAAALE